MRKLCLALLFFFAQPLMAQDETPTPYDIALQRIEEARVSGATYFELNYLGLTELPPEIGQLENLETLRVEGNQLTSLPAEIGNLHNLTVLSLGVNQLSSLPSEIFSLYNLQTLAINNNQLTTLPRQIGNLRNLTTLILSNNHLSSLPLEIIYLYQLEELSLGNNQLTSLAPSIRNLSNLCRLRLENNLIATLPTEISQLEKLGTEGCILQLEGNPLISPPPEVQEEGTAAILSYVRNESWWWHMQRLLVTWLGVIGTVTVAVIGMRWSLRGKIKRA